MPLARTSLCDWVGQGPFQRININGAVHLNRAGGMDVDMLVGDHRTAWRRRAHLVGKEASRRELRVRRILLHHQRLRGSRFANRQCRRDVPGHGQVRLGDQDDLRRTQLPADGIRDVLVARQSHDGRRIGADDNRPRGKPRVATPGSQLAGVPHPADLANDIVQVVASANAVMVRDTSSLSWQQMHPLLSSIVSPSADRMRSASMLTLPKSLTTTAVRPGSAPESSRLTSVDFPEPR